MDRLNQESRCRRASRVRLQLPRLPWFWVGVGLLAACGVKAPPQPRETRVPAPVEDVTVSAVPEGVRVAFTLPSTSLDGTPLAAIGGYRLLRQGPREGWEERERVRFSVTEQRTQPGAARVLLDAPPPGPGIYQYCVQPVDVYGSGPSPCPAVSLTWEGAADGGSGPPAGAGARDGAGRGAGGDG